MQPTHEPIGIIGAMHCELSLLLASMEQHAQAEFYGLSFHTGLLCGRQVVLVKAGIGKVNAARCTQLLIDHYHPAAIINTGIAGGLAPGLQVGDVVVADGLLQHDFDVTAFGHAKGYLCTGEDDQHPTVFHADRHISDTLAQAAQTVLPKERVHRGLIATGDQFISTREQKAALYDTFHAAAAEMEGGAIAQVAALSGVPFAVIRAISDLADGTAASAYDVFEQQAANHSAATVQQTLRLWTEKE